MNPTCSHSFLSTFRFAIPLTGGIAMHLTLSGRDGGGRRDRHHDAHVAWMAENSSACSVGIAWYNNAIGKCWFNGGLMVVNYCYTHITEVNGMANGMENDKPRIQHVHGTIFIHFTFPAIHSRSRCHHHFVIFCPIAL